MIGLFLLSLVAMILQDLFGILMVQAEARNHAWLTGHFDTLQMLATITTTSIYVTVLQGHQFSHKVLVIIALTIGNYVGALTAIPLGKKFIKEVD